MSVDNTAIVVGLQKRVEAARLQRARAEASLTQANTALETAKEALAVFGVSTPEEAAQLLKELQTSFEEERSHVEAGLLEIENAPRAA